MYDPRSDIGGWLLTMGVGIVGFFFGHFFMGEWINKVTMPFQNKFVNPKLRMIGIKYPDIKEKNWVEDRGVKIINKIIGILLVLGGAFQIYRAFTR